MELVLYPDERLNKPCLDVEVVTQELKQLAKDMYEFMKKNNGIGLAANQIGENISLIVADNNGGAEYLFNPKVVFSRNEMYKDEACLSFPGDKYKVKRPQEIMVKYLNINGALTIKPFKGLIAQVIGHEIDHLNGITVVDKIKNQKRGKKYED